MRVAAALFVTLTSISVAAAQQSTPAMTLTITGQEQAPDLVMTTLTLGPGITRAVRLYSEPSHTLVGVAVDSRLVPNATQSDWWAMYVGSTALPRRTPLLSTEFREGKQVAFQSGGRPERDRYLAVYVWGIYPDGEERDDLFKRIIVPKNFSITISKFGPLDTLTCCGAQNCTGCQDGGTVSCKPWDIPSCCLETTQECGQCGKLRAVCGFCPTC